MHSPTTKCRISPGNQPHQNRSTHHNHGTVWASQSLVTLCTFYRQICSLTYSLFVLKLPPPACPALLVYIYIYIFAQMNTQTLSKTEEANKKRSLFLSADFAQNQTQSLSIGQVRIKELAVNFDRAKCRSFATNAVVKHVRSSATARRLYSMWFQMSTF